MLKTAWHIFVVAFVGYSLYGSFIASKEASQKFPYKPIRVVVPYNPGGGTDTFVRIINKAIKDEKLMPHPMVVVNKPGGATTIGSSYVKYSKPDGYTMLCLHEALMTTKATGQSPHGPEAFEHISATGEEGQMILVSKNSPYQTMAELMKAAHEKPNTVTFGITQNAPPHFSGIMLEKTVEGTAFRFVPTGGAANRLSSLLGGHVDAAIFTVSEFIRYRDSGLNALVYLGNERNTAIPEVPTGKELGFDVVNSNLQYWWFPKDTPKEIVSYMTGVFARAMETDYVKGKLDELKITPKVISGAALQKRIDSKMSGFSLMKVDQRTSLPDMTFWTICAILIFAVLSFARRKKHFTEKEESEVIPRNDLALGVTIMTLGYAVLLSVGGLGFRTATLVFVLATGFYLTGFAKDKRIYIFELGLIMSFGLYFVFTQIFLIDLP
ncbi:MAG: tripartite tricarboxylate transporter substrate-binding protein [Lentisphaeraceae bacterium]|nr:tripartite tricarboxylate transporter substrate-binding protein [Lentisphaeraceae bacterium]